MSDDSVDAADAAGSTDTAASTDAAESADTTTATAGSADTATESAEPADGDSVAVRIRGIYTTALTQLLGAAGHEVVQASPPIRRRFDRQFSRAPYTVAVETGPDRQGVGVHGEPAATARIREQLGEVGVDTLAWTDPVPQGAVYHGRVTETLGGGAVVDVGVDADGGHDGAGYLPYDEVDSYVDDGDSYTVQVTEPTAPWDSDRPGLTTTLRAHGGLATLVRGREETRVRGGNGDAARELAGMTELLSVDTPDGWGIEWNRAAPDAELDALEASLSRASERAHEIETALAGSGNSGTRVDNGDAEANGGDTEVDGGDTEAGGGDIGVDSGSAVSGDTEPRALSTPLSTVWVWFGRESRFALDDHRRVVTSTMPGHHRTKAASRAASSGVDFAEALCSFDGNGASDASEAGNGEATSDETGTDQSAAESGGRPTDREFPFTVVTDQFGPTVGDSVAIGHGKPDGRLISLGRGEVTERESDGTVAVERSMTGGGTYDALGVERERGDTAVTKFREGRWWYPTVYRSADGDLKGTYVNVCTPVEVFPDVVRYVDLHVDVIRHRDGTVERVDDDELDAAVADGLLPRATAARARSVAVSVERALEK